MRPNPQENADLVTFTEEILNGKLHFFVQWLLLARNHVPVETMHIQNCFKKLGI